MNARNTETSVIIITKMLNTARDDSENRSVMIQGDWGPP